MVTKEPTAEFVTAHPGRVPSVAQSALAEDRRCAVPQQADSIIVTMDLDLPDSRVFPAELELIEQHLGDLLQEMLLMDEAKE